MKVCFVWTSKFRNFENFGFNTSSSAKFKYDPTSNFITIENERPLPNNFFGERVIDVIGIIGKNGSGKSNAIELMIKALKGPKTSITGEFLIILEKDDELICYYYFLNKEAPKAKFKILIEPREKSIEPIKVVFFSNVFDDRRNGFDNDVSDISINNRLTGNHFSYDNKHLTDFEKQIALISSPVFKNINIALPKRVLITSKVWAFNINNSRFKADKNHDCIKKLKNIFKTRIRDIQAKNKLFPLIKFTFFLEMYLDIYKLFMDKDTTDIEDSIPNIYNLRTDELSEQLIEYLEKELNSKRFVFSSGIPRVDKIRWNTKKLEDRFTFLRNLSTSLTGITFSYNFEGGRNNQFEYFSIGYEQEAERNFIESFANLFSDSSLIDINWIGISSGHKAYLNLFSSINHELRSTKQNNLLLCIDEGDLYLHPKWQIEFFDMLVKILPVIYPGNIQLVLTSHSPFLLSDLPKQNITILDSDISGSMDGIDLKIETFGGNLYDLYAEPFLLGSQRTSDFANNKMKYLIKLVEQKQLSTDERALAEHLCSLIGDEFLKYKVQKILKND